MSPRTSSLKSRLLTAAAVTTLALAGFCAVPLSARAQSSASAYTTGYRWDSLRRIVGIIKPDPDGSGPIGFPAVRYTYDADDSVVKTETGFLASWQDQTVLPANWTGFTIKSIKTNTLDAMGNKTQELLTDGAGNNLTLTQTAYDGEDRAVCVAVRMNLSTTATNACALGPAGSYGNDRITTTHYDGDGRVDYTKRAVGSANEEYYAHYSYSADGEKLNETDANNNTTSFWYDGYNRLFRIYYPSTTTANTSNASDYEEFGYDNNGSRTSYRRRNGQTYTYQYDAINQQTLKTRSDNTGLNVASSYDLLGHLIQAKFANGSGVLSYSYDGAGRMLSTTDMYGQGLSYQYDQGSLRTQMTFQHDGQQQGYQYNLGNQLTWTGIQGQSFGYSVIYDAFDRVTTITRSNGANTSIGYDSGDRVMTYGHSFANSNRNVTWTFTFDPASEVINASTTNTDFEYREQQSATDNHTYNGLNQDSAIAALQTSCSTAGAGYDCNGNLTNDSSRQFTYDIDNHLTGLSGPANASYVYDPIGRLVQTTVNGTVTRFLYDGTDLVAETDSSGNILMRYMHTLGTDQPWVQFTGAAVAASNAKYLYTNYQGSIVALADNTGAVADSDLYKYGPYGEPRDINNNLSFSGSRFRYTGQTVLPEASLYYYKARVYDPSFGRFLQTDPIGSADNLDLYAYTADDPINKSDPTGELTPGDTFGVFVFGAGVGVVSRWAGDIATGHRSTLAEYTGSAVEGGTTAALVENGVPPAIASGMGGMAGETAKQGVEIASGDRKSFDGNEIVKEGSKSALSGFVVGAVIPEEPSNIPGITSGRNSAVAVAKTIVKKVLNGTVKKVSGKTMKKMAVAAVAVTAKPVIVGVYENTVGNVIGSASSSSSSRGE